MRDGRERLPEDLWASRSDAFLYHSGIILSAGEACLILCSPLLRVSCSGRDG